ncbi:MAG: ABC transporter permease [Candidatus Saliniplasma sp.]
MLEKYIKSKRKRYIMRRVLKAIPVILIATLIAFLMMRVGGADPARRKYGAEASEDLIEDFNEEHGLDKPLHEQYISWFTGLFKGELGTSMRYERPVSDLVWARMPITIQLMGLALLISIIVGVSMGVLGALKHNTWIDYLATIEALFWRSIPSFWAGTIFLLVFAFRLDLFPIGGHPGGWGGLYYLILPASVLGLRLQAIIARLTRSSMLSVLNRDYIKSAKTKGLKKRVVIFKHALRNALIPVVTVIAMRLPWLFGGAMVTEQIFNLAGMGRLLLEGIHSRDFIMVQSVVLLITIIAVVANLLADVSYTFVDPRIELESSEEG